MEIGESFVGTGPNAASVSTVLGDRDGSVGAAWVAALATPTAGHAPFVAVLQRGLAVKPSTLVVNKARIDGTGHARMNWGPVQAGVAAGVADTVAGGMLTEAEAEQQVLIVAVFVDPAADDADALFANHREAVRSAIVIGRGQLPAARDAASKRNEAWNPFYRPTPPTP
ncbi:MAG: formaldehyde-activating enzyme [Acidimicrobiia bacterium]|nr:formaldehyde-activating enzyme [Acidimicrobiia bacterium]